MAAAHSSTEIVDLYRVIPRRFLPPRPTYANYSKVKIELPFRMAICGASGSRKTQLAINLVRIIGAWNRIYLFAKDLKEPLYRYMIDWFEKLQKKLKLKEPILYYSNDVGELPSPDALDRTMSNLVIVDDMICEGANALKNVSEYFVRGRKQNCSVMFITQSYYHMPKLLRSNCDLIALMRVNTGRDLGRITSEYSLGVDKAQLAELYRYCANSGDRNAFFLIDVANPDMNLRFRCGFKGIRLQDDFS